MAITNNGTIVTVPDGQLPSGYTKPTVTTFSDAETTYENRSFTVAKSAVENAVKVTTMTALVAAINAAVDALLANDFVASNTVTAYADLKSYRTDQIFPEKLLTDAVVNYICIVDVYVKTA